MANPHLAPRPVYMPPHPPAQPIPRTIAVDRLAQVQQQCNAYADRKAMAARDYADQKIAAHVAENMRGGWLIAIGLLGACTVVNVVITVAVLGVR